MLWKSNIPEIIRGAIERWKTDSRAPKGEALIEMLSKEWDLLLKAEEAMILNRCENALKDWARRNGHQFGHGGAHHGSCGEGLHHHHDNMCEAPWYVLAEAVKKIQIKPEKSNVF